jgi:hypothetical protein
MLSVGTLVYALDRGGTAYFLPAWLIRDAGPAVFGALGAHLPTFIHPFAFVLITAAALCTFDPLDILSIGLGVTRGGVEFIGFRIDEAEEVNGVFVIDPSSSIEVSGGFSLIFTAF